MKLHVDVFTHPKVKRFRRLLPEVSEAAAVGHLASLWAWAMTYAPEGSLAKYDDGDIADAALYVGDAAEFVGALVRAGLLDRAEDGALAIHDWDVYGGRYLEQRETARQNAARWREEKKTEDSATKRTRATKAAAGRGVDMTAFHEQFWPLYPRKQGKALAEKAWASFDPTPAQIEEVIAALRKQAKSATWKDEPKYIPHPATWINGKRWCDEWPEAEETPKRKVEVAL